MYTPLVEPAGLPSVLVCKRQSGITLHWSWCAATVSLVVSHATARAVSPRLFAVISTSTDFAFTKYGLLQVCIGRLRATT
jgi:hypothetical protein